MTPVRVSASVSEQLVAMHARNAARALLPLLLAIMFSYLLLNGKVAASALLIWATLASVIVIVRALLLARLRDSRLIPRRNKPIYAAAMSFLAGSSFGLVLVFFPDVASFERAMLTAILLGIASGAISSNLGYRPLFIAYTLPMLGPLGSLWIANPGSLVDSLLAFSIGICCFLVGITHAIMGQDVFDAFALSVKSSRALEKRSRELSIALKSAEMVKARAEDSSSSKSRFIAAASHDLRQPVHILNLYGAALVAEPLTPRARTIADDMKFAMASLSSQLNTLLDISELDGGRVVPRIKPIDLSALALTLENEFRMLAENKQIALVNKVREPVHVSSDPTMLAQILRNICGNAIKYTHAGSVMITIGSRGDQVALSIFDTGIGIGLRESDRVFEEYFQVAKSDRDRSLGTGLGLSIVERLVRKLGHSIELRSRPRIGTRVTLLMDRAEVEPSVPEVKDDKVAKPLHAADLPAGFWVHLVDDDNGVRRGMQAVLELRDIYVTTTDSSEQTLDFLSSNEPSAVLVDIRLSEGESGLHLIDELAHHHPLLPVALITGHASFDTAIMDRHPGLLIMQRPVPMEELFEMLHYMARYRARRRKTPAKRKDAGVEA